VRNFLKIPPLILSACLVLPAHAVEWAGSVGADLRWFDWREYQRNRQLLMETGPLATAVGKIEFRQGSEGVFSSLEAAWGGGLAHYDGHLQSGPAYETDAWEEIIDAELRLGWRSERGSVHLGYMQRDWRRFLDGSPTVSSAEERYRWRLVTLGGEAPLFSSPRWRVALNLGLPTESYQKVYAGNADDFVLEPGAGFFWRLSFPYRPEAERFRAMTFEPYYQQQNMQDSDSVLLRRNGVSLNQRAYQPASYRRELGVTWRWRLGGK
jgi:hypothetical protein